MTARRTWIAALTVVATLVAVAFLATAVDGSELAAARTTLQTAPGGVLLGLAAFGTAFLLRAEAWHRVLPELSRSHALAGIHLALGGNHLLPLRLGEPLRVLSVVRRADVDVRAATASTVALRSADVVALLLLGVLAGPRVVGELLGPAGAAAAAVVGLLGAAALWWLGRRRGLLGALPGLGVVVLVVGAWLLEAVLVWQVASVFGAELTAAGAVVVLAAAIAGQLVAVTPGGIGTYEVAATAGLVAVGVPASEGMALALGLHAVLYSYSLTVGAIAVIAPAPGIAGALRLPRELPPRPEPLPVTEDAPVVLFLPALDEGPRVAEVVGRAPEEVLGHPVEVLVVDDGSTDDTVARARAAGAEVVQHERNRGLGAAVRTGFSWADARAAAAVAFCDADGEYDPAELERLVVPVLSGEADYVAGSRFAGDIEWMRPHRRLGNQVLTQWVRFTVRQPVTDGQSGYRAFSPAAVRVAEIPHDYNYAQVLTITLVGLGFAYHEVPITYRFRKSGDSFVRLGSYLRRVVPTVWRQLNPGAANTGVPAATRVPLLSNWLTR